MEPAEQEELTLLWESGDTQGQPQEKREGGASEKGNTLVLPILGIETECY